MSEHEHSDPALYFYQHFIEDGRKIDFDNVIFLDSLVFKKIDLNIEIIIK